VILGIPARSRRGGCQTFDKSILIDLRSIHTPLLDRLMLGFTALGDPNWLVVICLSLGMIAITRNRRSEATTIAIVSLGALGLNIILKQLFARTRPQLWERIVDVDFYSFPSGHAMMSMVIYSLLSYFFASHFPRWRVGFFSLAIMLIAAVGLSRLYLGVHWPTDIIGGYMAGLVWVIASIVIFEIWNQYSRSISDSQEKFLPEDS
jgi:membrane-associated phospholipid phosphatase